MDEAYGLVEEWAVDSMGGRLTKQKWVRVDARDRQKAVRLLLYPPWSR